MFRSPKKSKQQAQFQSQGRPPVQQEQQPPMQHQQSKHHIPNPFSSRKQSPKALASPSFTTNSGFSTPPRAGASPVTSHHSKFTSPGSPVGSSNSEQQRKLVTDKIISDCYSKTIHQGDRKLNEVSYITHIGIIEYSHSPSGPPPPNSNPGSVKHRILVLCKKHTGRMQLQKGKFQAEKNYYQIGRTWDLSELQSIKRVGLDGLILQLNKTYYWKCDEDERRVWKFARYLCQHYGMFTGRYPKLDGFSLDDFMLPSTPKSPSTTPSRTSSVKDPTPDPQLMKSRSLKRKNMPNPILPTPPVAAPTPPQIPSGVSKTTAPSSANVNDLYKDMDFTVNGGLPQKPMKVIQRDSPKSTGGGTLDPGPSLYGPSSRPNKPHAQSQPMIPHIQPQPQTQPQPQPHHLAHSESMLQTRPQPRSQPQSFARSEQGDSRGYQRGDQSKKNLNREFSPPTMKANQHPYYQKTPMNGLDNASEISNDSHSFIFNNKESSQEKLEETAKQEQPKFSGDVLESVSESIPSIQENNEPIQRRSHPYANSHAKKDSQVSQKSAEDVVKEFSESIPSPLVKPKMAASANVPDFGVEEITDDSDDDQRPTPTFSIRKRQQQKKALEKAQNLMPTPEEQQQQPGLESVNDVTDSFMDKSSRYDADKTDRFDIDKSSRYDEKSFVTQKGLGIYPPNSNSFIEESTKVEGQTRIDSHMQEIQDMLNSHLGDAKEESFPYDDKDNEGYEDVDDLNDDDDLNNEVPLGAKSRMSKDMLHADDDFEEDGDSFEPGLNIVKKSATPESGGTNTGSGITRSNTVIIPDCDRDAEVDNILDDIGWSVQDDASTLIKKLNKEATNTKQDIVSKLVSIDLTNNSGSDIGSALNEVDNMTNIFQKMEVKLKLLHNDLQNSVYV